MIDWKQPLQTDEPTPRAVTVIHFDERFEDVRIEVDGSPYECSKTGFPAIPWKQGYRRQASFRVCNVPAKPQESYVVVTEDCFMSVHCTRNGAEMASRAIECATKIVHVREVIDEQ